MPFIKDEKDETSGKNCISWEEVLFTFVKMKENAI